VRVRFGSVSHVEEGGAGDKNSNHPRDAAFRMWQFDFDSSCSKQIGGREGPNQPAVRA
jgi:hypothetical protein